VIAIYVAMCLFSDNQTLFRNPVHVRRECLIFMHHYQMPDASASRYI
jgi:hypothetical protein